MSLKLGRTPALTCAIGDLSKDEEDLRNERTQLRRRLRELKTEYEVQQQELFVAEGVLSSKGSLQGDKATTFGDSVAEDNVTERKLSEEERKLKISRCATDIPVAELEALLISHPVETVDVAELDAALRELHLLIKDRVIQEGIRAAIDAQHEEEKVVENLKKEIAAMRLKLACVPRRYRESAEDIREKVKQLRSRCATIEAEAESIQRQNALESKAIEREAANFRSQASQLDVRIEEEREAQTRYEKERASQGHESAELRRRIAVAREKLRKASPSRLLKVAFAKFDEDGSGKLTADEVAKAIAFTRREGEPGVSTEDVERFIRYRDANGDGEIDFQEFCEYFGQL